MNLKIHFNSKLNILFALLLLIPAAKVASQPVVSHNITEVTNTAVFFHYFYQETNAWRNIDYFIVKSPSGDIKVAFDACDVCYKSYKGFRQEDTYMKCNSCGNKFLIDDLGTKNQSGGCWPGYLPRVADNNTISISTTDLIGGAWYFRLVPNSVDEKAAKNNFSVLVSENQIKISTNSSGFKQINLINLNGKIVKSLNSNNTDIFLDRNKLISGFYLINVSSENGALSKRVLIQ